MNFYSHQVYSVLFLFRYILLQAAILTNTIIIFLYKENIIIKENLWIQKRQYILKFTLDVFFCPEFIFFWNAWLHFVYASLFCCSKLDFHLTIHWILVDKDAMKWRKKQQHSGAFFHPERKSSSWLLGLFFPFLIFSWKI